MPISPQDLTCDIPYIKFFLQILQNTKDAMFMRLLTQRFSQRTEYNYKF